MTELPNIAQFFLALFLFAIWFTHRSNQTPLCWAIAYFALATASLSLRVGNNSGSTFLVGLAWLLPGIYVGMFWAGTQYFRARQVRWQSVALLVCGTSCLIVLDMSTSVRDSDFAVGFAVGLINVWAAWVIWKRNIRYRLVAFIVMTQAIVLVLSYWRIWQGPSVDFVMAAGYGFLVIGLVHVILRESNDSISRQATIDELTGLPNRHLLLDRLDIAIRRSDTFASLTCAVLVIDIDNLRRFNEAFGRKAGNQLLREIGARLQRVAGTQHTLARYGGDEFAFLVTESSADDAIRRAEEVSIRTVETMRLPFPVATTTTLLNVSIGIAISGQDGDSASLLVQRAKFATTQTPLTDGNSWRFFCHVKNDSAQRQITLERHMGHALRSGEFSIAYQPIVAANGREIVKVEALLRWRNPELGIIEPDEFIRIAEHSGLIIELGQWVLDQACQQAAVWQRERKDRLVICVNVSARQLLRPDFSASVAETLERHALPASFLELEFTESIMIDDDSIVLAQIKDLRRLGISLSLDDFGTGFSSLSYLTRFEFNTIKIDRSFVRALESDERSWRLAESICAIGKSLGIALVAEGVETEFQGASMAGFGVDYMQGFLYGEPVTAEAFR